LSDNPGCGIKRVRDFNGCMRISILGVRACEMPGEMFMLAVVVSLASGCTPLQPS